MESIKKSDRASRLNGHWLHLIIVLVGTRDAIIAVGRMHLACRVHASTYVLQYRGPPSRMRTPYTEEDHIARSWYLRLKQIKRYQAFRTGDKEHRGYAEASEAPGGSVIQISTSGGMYLARLTVTHVIFAARAALYLIVIADDYWVITNMLLHLLKIYENYCSSGHICTMLKSPVSWWNQVAIYKNRHNNIIIRNLTI